MRPRSSVLRPGWRLVVLAAPALAALGLVAGAVSAVRAAPDLTGVWKIVNTSGPGAAGTLDITNGKNGAFDGTGYGGAWNIKGSVSGNAVRYTVSNSSSYSSKVVGTLSSDGTRITYSWSDTNNQKGSAYLLKEGAAPSTSASTTTTTTTTTTTATTTTPAPPVTTPCGATDCSGVDLSILASLLAGETSASVQVGCSGVRSTAGLSTAASSACAEINLDQNSPDVKAWDQMLKDAAAGIPGGLLEDLQKSFPELFPGTGAPNPSAVKAAEQVLDGLRDVSSPQGDQSLQDLDGMLESAFPPDDSARATASARVAGVAATVIPAPSAAIKSIYSRHPTRAQAKAFTDMVALATARKYSRARALARVTLSIADLIGSHELAHEIGKAKRVVLGSVHLKHPVQTPRAIAFATSPFGGRLLRLLVLHGLAHPVKVHVVLSGPGVGGSATTNEQLAIR